MSGDPFDDPHWQQAELMVGATLQTARGYVTCPLTWLERVRSIIRSPDQLIVLLLLYSQCLIERSQTVRLGNSELAGLGIGRYTKYRALKYMQDAGAITFAEVENGRSVEVTLHWFP
jgi:hypothetical protein